MDRDAFLSKLRSDLDWFDDVGFQYNRDGTVEANALINGVVFHLYLGKCDGTGMGIQLINNAGRKMFGSYEEFCSKVKLYSYTHGIIVPDAKALAVIFDDEINQTSLYTGVGSMNGKSVAKFKLVGSDSFVVIGEKEESVYTASYITNDNKLIFSQDYFVDEDNEFHKVATFDDYTRCLVRLYGDSAEFDIDKVSKNRYTVTGEGMKIGYDVSCQDDEYFFDVYSVNGEEVQYHIQLKNPYSLEELFQQVRQREGSKLAQLDVSADDLFDDSPEVIEGSPEETAKEPEEATEEQNEAIREQDEAIEEPEEEPDEAVEEHEETFEEHVVESAESSEVVEEHEEPAEETEGIAQEEPKEETVISGVDEVEQSEGYEAEEPVDEEDSVEQEEAAEIESIDEHEEPETIYEEEEFVKEVEVEESVSEEPEQAETIESGSFVEDHMSDYSVSEERRGEDDDMSEESHEAIETEQAAVQAEDVPNTVESKSEEAVMDDFSIKTLEGEGVEVYMDGVLYLVPEGILKESGIPSEIFTEKDVRASRFGVSLTGMERVHKTFLVHVTEENSSAVVSGMLSRLFS